MLTFFVISVAVSLFMIHKMSEYRDRPKPIGLIILATACYITTGILFNLTFLQ